MDQQNFLCELQYYRKMGCGTVNPDNVQSLSSPTVLTINRIYQRKELIGTGTYGKVYRCINKLNGGEYALKVVQITGKTKEEAIRQINNLKSEIGVLKKMNHENIVKYYSFDISDDNRHVEIVFEYATKGCLKNYIQKNGALSQSEARRFMVQILNGLAYLHGCNIVHRDLKCANILLMENGEIKISDFGTAKLIKIESHEDIAKLCSSLKGTPYYMAPQVLKRTGHSTPADIWSLACLLIEMLTGKAPWTTLTTDFEEIISYIVSGIQPPIPKGLSQPCNCFLASCLDPIPNLRLAASELLKHRWIDETPLRSISQKSGEFLKKTDVLDELDNRMKLQKAKQSKIQEIDRYLTNKAVSSKRKTSSTKGKQKKDRSASFKLSESELSLVQQQIQIHPHRGRQSREGQNSGQSSLLSGRKEKSKPGLLKKDDYMKITKTTPDMKLPQSMIAEAKELDQHSFEVPIRPAKEGVIDTLISRQERLKYQQAQRKLRQQRDQQRKKWQQQLKQGANYLRNQINNRYQL